MIPNHLHADALAVDAVHFTAFLLLVAIQLKSYWNSFWAIGLLLVIFLLVLWGREGEGTTRGSVAIQ